MGKDKRCSGRTECETCCWYDALGDLCRNRASPNEWENMTPGEKCKYWEEEK